MNGSRNSGFISSWAVGLSVWLALERCSIGADGFVDDWAMTVVEVSVKMIKSKNFTLNMCMKQR